MNATMIGDAGGSESHNNIQPYLTVNFCIATVGIFPARP
jgi:microcystin-dependent protein